MYCNSLTLAVFGACRLCPGEGSERHSRHTEQSILPLCPARVKEAVRQQPAGFILNRRGTHYSTFPRQRCSIPGSCGTHHTQILRSARPAAATREELPEGTEGSPCPSREAVPTGLEYGSGLVLKAPRGFLMCSWGGNHGLKKVVSKVCAPTTRQRGGRGAQGKELEGILNHPTIKIKASIIRTAHSLRVWMYFCGYLYAGTSTHAVFIYKYT